MKHFQMQGAFLACPWAQKITIFEPYLSTHPSPFLQETTIEGLRLITYSIYGWVIQSYHQWSYWMQQHKNGECCIQQTCQSCCRFPWVKGSFMPFPWRKPQAPSQWGFSSLCRVFCQYRLENLRAVLFSLTQRIGSAGAGFHWSNHPNLGWLFFPAIRPKSPHWKPSPATYFWAIPWHLLFSTGPNADWWRPSAPSQRMP